MNAFKNDPLLAFCNLLAVLILLWAALSGLAALLFGMAGLFGGDRFAGMLRLSYPEMSSSGPTAFAISMFCIVAGLAIVLLFMRQLIALIRSVQGGEAFNLANAARIRTMAWLSLAGIPAGIAIAATLAAAVKQLGPEVADAGLHVRPLEGWVPGWGQVLMTLLLFVLARLFAQAAVMRDEIEGTV